MKSFEHFRINVAILRAQIADLALEEIGSYMRLILHQLEVGAIPNDSERIKAICGWKVNDAVVRKFEVCADGMLRMPWVDQQLKQQEKICQQRTKAGRLRQSKCSANAQHVLEGVTLCGCGCGKPVKPGRKFVDRTHANRYHGQNTFSGKPITKVIQETAGHGSAVDQTRFQSSL